MMATVLIKAVLFSPCISIHNPRNLWQYYSRSNTSCIVRNYRNAKPQIISHTHTRISVCFIFALVLRYNSGRTLSAPSKNRTGITRGVTFHFNCHLNFALIPYFHVHLLGPKYNRKDWAIVTNTQIFQNSKLIILPSSPTQLKNSYINIYPIVLDKSLSLNACCSLSLNTFCVVSYLSAGY